METQKTVNDWAIKTFGRIKNPQTAIDRMLKEVRELEKLSRYNDAAYEKMADECADILITLYRVIEVLGYNLHSCVDHKMEINRARKWKLNNDGTGQHVEE